MIYALVNRLARSPHGRFFIASAKHRHNWLTKSMNSATARSGAVAIESLLPAHHSTHGEFKRLRHRREFLHGFEHIVQFEPRRVTDGKGGKHYWQYYDRRAVQSFFATSRQYRQTHRASSKDHHAKKYAPFKPSLQFCRLKVNKFPSARLRKFHAPFMSRPRMAVSLSV